MTNKDLLDSISQEMKELYKKREAELEEVSKSKYSDGLKRQMRKEIMDNFYAEMDKFKGRPGYEEAIKTARHEKSLRGKLERLERQRELLQEKYEQAQIAHRGQVEFTEEIEIPQKLKDFREKWEKNIDLDEDIKKKIIDAVNKIQKGAREESDGSIGVKFELGGKAYKTLDVNVAKHSDKEYLASYKYNWQEKNEVKLGGMRGDDTRQRENRTLADYVDSEKNNRGMEIRTVEFQKDLISKLGDEAGLTDMGDKIAMWMYLTGNYGYYWGTMGTHEKSYPAEDSRSKLRCHDNIRYFLCVCNDSSNASLCMIACE